MLSAYNRRRMAAWIEFSVRGASMSDPKQTTFSRRGFLKGAGLTAAGTLLEEAEALTAEVKKAAHESTTVGPDAVSVRLQVNGQAHAVSVEPRETLGGTPRGQRGGAGAHA